MTFVFLYSCLSLFLIHVLYFFYSFHLDAPTTIPTPTTNPVNTQGTVCPHYCPSQQSCMYVCVCVCELACTFDRVIRERKSGALYLRLEETVDGQF